MLAAEHLTVRLAPVIALSTCVLLHIAISRTMPFVSRHRAIVASVVVGFVAVGGFGVWSVLNESRATISEQIGTLLLLLISYLALVYCYVFGFYNMGESARRVRILRELLSAGERGMSLKEMLQVYNAGMILDIRLERLATAGQIIEKNGRYMIGSRQMLAAAKTMAWLQTLLLK